MKTLKKTTEVTSCESCLNYEYDEEFDEYSCIMDLDEDDMVGFLTGHTQSCPFYQYNDEYIIVHKQI